MLINGRYIISMTARFDPKATYQLANWAIRQSLEALDDNRDGPRNVAQLTDWLAEREGQILSRTVNGERTQETAFGIVYDATSQCIRFLNRRGIVQNAACLQQHDGAAHFVYHKGGQTRYFDIWRTAKQYQPWVRQDDAVAQRHGAFLLKDHLIAQNTPVTLPHRDGALEVSFNDNGQATVDRTDGLNEATWRITAYHLEVDVTNEPRRKWHWDQAGTPAGFEIPLQAIRPWEVPQRFAATDPAQGQPEAVRASETRKTRLLREIKAVQERTKKAIRAAFQKNEEEFSKATQTATQKLIQRIEQGHDRR